MDVQECVCKGCPACDGKFHPDAVETGQVFCTCCYEAKHKELCPNGCSLKGKD